MGRRAGNQSCRFSATPTSAFVSSLAAATRGPSGFGGRRGGRVLPLHLQLSSSSRSIEPAEEEQEGETGCLRVCVRLVACGKKYHLGGTPV